MREFVYFSKSAKTSGAFKNVMEGRMDIACHVVIMSFFVSNARRKNVKLHMFFYGSPDPPKHLEIFSPEEEKEEFASISKKDVLGLIKRMLFKYKKGQKFEAFPNCFIEKKSIIEFLEEKSKEGRAIYILDKKGEDIRKAEISDNPIFVLGDQEGIPKAERKRIEKFSKKISLGNITYFASQSVSILQNELDRRGIF